MKWRLKSPRDNGAGITQWCGVAHGLPFWDTTRENFPESPLGQEKPPRCSALTQTDRQISALRRPNEGAALPRIDEVAKVCIQDPELPSSPAGLCN